MCLLSWSSVELLETVTNQLLPSVAANNHAVQCPHTILLLRMISTYIAMCTTNLRYLLGGRSGGSWY